MTDDIKLPPFPVASVYDRATCTAYYSAKAVEQYAQEVSFARCLRLQAQRDALREALQGAANYIDTLGGESKKYRIALGQHQGENV